MAVINEASRAVWSRTMMTMLRDSLNTLINYGTPGDLFTCPWSFVSQKSGVFLNQAFLLGPDSLVCFVISWVRAGIILPCRGLENHAGQNKTESCTDHPFSPSYTLQPEDFANCDDFKIPLSYIPNILACRRYKRPWDNTTNLCASLFY